MSVAPSKLSQTDKIKIKIENEYLILQESNTLVCHVQNNCGTNIMIRVAAPGDTSKRLWQNVSEPEGIVKFKLSPRHIPYCPLEFTAAYYNEYGNQEIVIIAEILDVQEKR